jgi:DNA topoisomerase-1
MTTEQKNVYELVCRRFLATLAKDAVSETISASIDISGEIFKASGYRVIEPNWKVIYTYFKEKKKPLPELQKGEKVNVSSIKLKEDQTKPPQRYTQGSLIVKMEQLSLGTKSTRHEIISKLYGRKYIQGSPPIPTSTAIAVVDALEGCDVVKPKMTAVLENNMDAIADGKKTLDETVTESRKMLTVVMESLEKDKEKIKANIQSAQREQNNIGSCPKCGKNLVIRSSKQGKRFVGCSGFPDCKNTYSLPQNGSIIINDKVCSKCSTPVVKVKMKDKKPWSLCLNSDCPGKKSRNNNSS